MGETFSLWDTQPTPEHLLTWRPAPASAAPEPGSAPPLIALTDGGQWRQEHGAVLTDEKETALYTALTLNYAEEEHHYYAEGIHMREHTTWVTTGPEDPTLGPLVMSVENLAPGQKSVRILLRARTVCIDSPSVTRAPLVCAGGGVPVVPTTCLTSGTQGDTRVSFPIQKGQPRDVIRAFTEETPQYDKVKWKEVGDDDMERVTHGLILCCVNCVMLCCVHCIRVCGVVLCIGLCASMSAWCCTEPLQELLDMERKAVKLLKSYKIGLLCAASPYSLVDAVCVCVFGMCVQCNTTCACATPHLLRQAVP